MQLILQEPLEAAYILQEPCLILEHKNRIVRIVNKSIAQRRQVVQVERREKVGQHLRRDIADRYSDTICLTEQRLTPRQPRPHTAVRLNDAVVLRL